MGDQKELDHEFKPSAANPAKDPPGRPKKCRGGFTRAARKAARPFYSVGSIREITTGSALTDDLLRAAGIRLHRPLSDSERSLVAKRVLKLREFQRLREQGFTAAKAAKAVKVSSVTLWRWADRIVPIRQQCGRASFAELLNVPPRLVEKVKRLQFGGLTNANAWRYAAQDPRCPSDLALHLKCAKNIAPSLLALSRLKRAGVNATILSAGSFSATVLEQNATGKA
jgi:hypothetical protein